MRAQFFLDVLPAVILALLMVGSGLWILSEKVAGLEQADHLSNLERQAWSQSARLLVNCWTDTPKGLARCAGNLVYEHELDSRVEDSTFGTLRIRVFAVGSELPATDEGPVLCVRRLALLHGVEQVVEICASSS